VLSFALQIAQSISRLELELEVDMVPAVIKLAPSWEREIFPVDILFDNLTTPMLLILS